MLERFSIGIDIVDIERFRAMPFNDLNINFYKKIFSESEIEYCMKHADPYKHFAGKFAIKEAVKKAISENIELSEIETLHKEMKPEVRIERNQNYKFIISISHEDRFAIGVVICEKP